MKRLMYGFFMAWGNFFAIPCPHKVWDDSCRSIMLGWFPIFGGIMGGLWYGLYLLCLKLGIPLQLAALVLALFPFLFSGCIHLDGFMDCSDAILSRRPLEERQKILKDSHVGAFAVISLAVLFLTCYAAMSALFAAAETAQFLHAASSSAEATALVATFVAALGKSGASMGASIMGAPLIIIPMVSRFVAARDVLTKKPLSHSQYSGTVKPGKHMAHFAVTALALLVVVAISCLAGGGNATLAVLCAELIACLLAGAYARGQLGGMSGDISGYTVTMGEAVAMLALALLV